MTDKPKVAFVLLVASEARRQVIRPWLQVVGEPVSYSVEVAAPELVASRRGLWDVVLIDGESVADGDARELVLMQAREHLGPTTLLHLCCQQPSDAENRQAFLWADDVIGWSWDVGDRVRRRVQIVALAPWLRGRAVRLEAGRLGERRLRVLRPSSSRPGTSPVKDPSPTRLPKQRSVRSRDDTFREGWQAGVAAMEEQLHRTCRAVLADAERGERAIDVEAIALVRAELARLSRKELEAIAREERPGEEPTGRRTP